MNLIEILNAKREIVERLSIRDLLDVVKLTVVYNEANEDYDIRMLVSEKAIDGRKDVMRTVTHILNDLMNSGVVGMYSNVSVFGYSMLYDYTVTAGR